MNFDGIPSSRPIKSRLVKHSSYCRSSLSLRLFCLWVIYLYINLLRRSLMFYLHVTALLDYLTCLLLRPCLSLDWTRKPGLRAAKSNAVKKNGTIRRTYWLDCCNSLRLLALLYLLVIAYSTFNWDREQSCKVWRSNSDKLI